MALELMVTCDTITGQEGNSVFAQKCANELREQNRGANTPVTPVNLKYGLELSSYRRKEGDGQRDQVQARTRDCSE